MLAFAAVGELVVFYGDVYLVIHNRRFFAFL